jgi:peroxiredoxin
MELPELIRLRAHYPADKVGIVAISVDKDAAALEKFVAKNKIPYPVYRDDGSISAMLKISSIPLNLLLNRNGTMAQAYQGLVKEAVLVKDIDKALAR